MVAATLRMDGCFNLAGLYASNANMQIILKRPNSETFCVRLEGIALLDRVITCEI